MEGSIAKRPVSRRQFLSLSAGAVAAVGLATLPASALAAPAPVAPARLAFQGTGSQTQRAEEIGKQYSGTTINMMYEGLQAGAIRLFAPEWTRKTGVEINITEAPYDQLYAKAVAEHEAGTGALDIVLASYFWVPDLVANGVIDPIDDYMKKYLTDEDLADIEKGRKIAMMEWDGQNWGMPVDGDAWLNYYRTDLFEEAGLEPPKTWAEYFNAAKTLTERGQGQYYGVVEQRAAGQAAFWFSQHYQSRGGKWFDPDTMEPLINKELGVQTLQDMMDLNKVGPPGMEKYGAVEAWSSFIDGRAAQCITWPPLGRFSEAAGGLANYPTWLPQTKVANKVGYAIPPDGHSLLSACYIWCIGSDSKNKEAAWAFMMWWSSPELATQLSTLPNSLMDPYRYSQFDSPFYRSLFPNAGKYLDALKAAGAVGVMDIKMVGGTEYQDAIDRAITSASGGKPVKEALDEAAAKFREITNRIGLENQKKSYAALLKQQADIEAIGRGG